ncbi:MAG: hypothetical protein QOI04_1139 [Verrucomicrobiota bacterium]|jgi:SAM-dependent methyltransferase
MKEECYPETRFGGFSRVDGTVVFFTRVQALLDGARIVVDVGCGRGARLEDLCVFRRKLADLRAPDRTVIGLDVSVAGETNSMVDVFHQITDQQRWPVEDNSVDVVVSDFVLEHIDDPNAFFGEVHRILKPGGFFCARTPNKWGYVTIISRLLPTVRHAKVISKVQRNRKEKDVFATVYRCNTASSLRNSLSALGMEYVVIPIESEPNYLTFNRTLYRCGVLLHRVLPDFLKSTLLVFARKTPG